MKDFTYLNPTRIEFGKDKEKNIGAYISDYGIKKVLLVYGSERIKSTGLFDTVSTSLKEKDIEFVELGGVKSNPVLGKVLEGIDLARKYEAEAVLGVGGGSVLDSSKAIAAGAKYDGDVWDLFTRKAVAQESLRIFDIMTLAATGSEMNNFAVVTKEETLEKLGMGAPSTFPTVSVINPELQATVSKDYLAYSAADIFAHCIDLYGSASYLPDYIAGHIENILRTVIRTTDILLEDADNYEARGEFAWAATQALNFSTFCGVENNRFDTHVIEHSLSALFDIAHGAGLSIVVPSWMRWQKNNVPGRFDRFAKEVFDVEGADAGIKALRDWYEKIGTPVTLEQGRISTDSIPEIVENVYSAAIGFGAETLYTKEMITEILETA